ncbi:MAG: PilZ domain-containing protein [Candidatus Omnitrophica bacterium]|nr:PilZ domain-containing protein [Candidatus Omnitrophota bacterium]
MKKLKSLKEQRRFPRRELYLPVFYKVPNRPTTSDWALTRDVSEQGIRFVSDAPIKEGTKLKLEIDIPGRLFLLLAEGKVVWARSLENQNRDKGQGRKMTEIGIKVDINSPLEAKLWSKFLKRRVTKAIDEWIEQLKEENQS